VPGCHTVCGQLYAGFFRHGPVPVSAGRRLVALDIYSIGPNLLWWATRSPALSPSTRLAASCVKRRRLPIWQ
jgi:hypothetical protein